MNCYLSLTCMPGHFAKLTLRLPVDCRQSTGRATTLHVSLTMDIDDRNCRIHAFYSLSTGLRLDASYTIQNTVCMTHCMWKKYLGRSRTACTIFSTNSTQSMCAAVLCRTRVAGETLYPHHTSRSLAVESLYTAPSSHNSFM